MTVHDRIKLVVKWLIGTGVANNQEAIGRLMGYSNKSSFSQILNNKVPIPNDFIGRLCALNENINKVWIEKEMGDMVVDMSTPTSSFGNVEDIPNIVPTQSDAIVLRLIDKLDEKDTLLKEKDTKIDLLQSELRAMTAELAALKAQHSQSQNKESDHHTKISEVIENFTSDSSGDYGEGYPLTKKPTSSKRSSAGKM